MQAPITYRFEDSLDANRSLEVPMQHFHVGNLDKIRDAPPKAWATVHCNDVVTFSELVRRGFHLVDMRGQVWTTLRQAGPDQLLKPVNVWQPLSGLDGPSRFPTPAQPSEHRVSGAEFCERRAG